MTRATVRRWGRAALFAAPAFVAVPHEYLSGDRIARYGRCPDEPSVADLEQYFRLTPEALTPARTIHPLEQIAGTG
ncbi:hypothetical protein [Nocardiopsis dassonvillei]|uniref:hypothetical protein n=1 Tax=Nocardiopsis dassonvillei TaxID=2014 RepID=UPI003F57AA3D